MSQYPSDTASEGLLGRLTTHNVGGKKKVNEPGRSPRKGGGLGDRDPLRWPANNTCKVGTMER